MQHLKGYGDYLFPHLSVHLCAFTLHLCAIIKIWWGPKDGLVKLNSIITSVSNVWGTKKERKELVLLKWLETWQWEGWGHHQLHGVPYTPKAHSWQHKFSSEVNLYSFPLHLPRMISATPLAKPCPSTPSPTLWATEVSPDPKLRDVRCSFWTQHFRKAFRATEEYLSPLPLPTVTEPLAELTSHGVNKTWIVMILRGMVLEETDTTGSNAIIYCAEDTVLQFLCDQLKRSENVMLKLCSNFQLLLVKLLL